MDDAKYRRAGAFVLAAWVELTREFYSKCSSKWLMDQYERIKYFDMKLIEHYCVDFAYIFPDFKQSSDNNVQRNSLSSGYS